MKSTNESQHATPGTADNKVAPHKQTVIFNPRWAVIIGILAIGFLYLALPESLTFGPSWLLLAIEVVLLIPLIFVGITRRPMPHITLRLFALAVLVVVTAGLAASIALLVYELLYEKVKPNFLLRSATLLWC